MIKTKSPKNFKITTTEKVADSTPVEKYEIADIHFADDGTPIVNYKWKTKKSKKNKKIDVRVLNNKKKKLPKSYYHPKAIADRKAGDLNEKRFQPIAEKWFGMKFKEDKKGWRVLDYLNPSKKIAVELKSRNNTMRKYPDTIIGYNKYDTARKYMLRGWKVYFFFKFTDGLYFWEVKNLLPFDITKEDRGTYARGFREYKPHLCIPINYLTKINRYNNYEEFLKIV